MLDGINFPDVLYDNHLREINGVKFTHREIEIIAFILNGRSGKKTASFLSISPKTVENHTRNIMEKLSCNSRESIIDFVEKSGKLLFAKQYYLSFLIHTEFEEILKRLGFFNEKLTCSIVYWEFQEDGYVFLPYLKAHLKLADVKVTYDNRQKWQSLSDLLSESSHNGYKLYLLPTLIFEEFQSSHDHKPIINHKSPPSKLFILPARKSLEELPIELKGCDSLDLTQHKNYYFLLFEILKRLFRKHSLEGTIVGFQDRIAALLSSTDPKRKSFHPCEKNMPPKKLPSKFTIQKSLKSKVFYVCFIFLCLGLASLLFQYYYPYTMSNHFKEQGKRLIRPELPIPPDSILLDRTELLILESQIKVHPERIQIIVLTGIGGSGKTTIARQYARLQKIPVVWEMNAETRETLLISFESLAYALSKTEEEKREVKELQDIKNPTEKEDKIIQWVKKHLHLSKRWLIIYDNVISFKNIQKYFPSDQQNDWGSGQVIMTTRNGEMQNNTNVSHVLPIKELGDDQKLSLFVKIVMNSSDSAPLTPLQIEQAKKFLKAIPSFPLDVSIAAHYLKRTHASYDKYLDYLKEYDTDFENMQKDVLEEVGDYHKTRYSIIALSLKELASSHPDFKDLLLLLTLLDSQNIPRDLLSAYKKDVIVDNFIHHLKTYSLINKASFALFPEMSFLSIHMSIQENSLIYLKRTLKLEENKHLLQPLVHTLETYISETISQQDFSKINTLSSHCRAFLTHSTLLTDEFKNGIGGELGNIYLHLSDYKAAQQILEESLAYFNKQKHQNKARIARFSIYLGNVYREMGNYDRAKNLFEESLHIYRNHFPKNQKTIARGLSHLGAIYRHIGDFIKARDLLEESLAIDQQYAFDNHLDSAWTMVHLGNTYREMGNYEKAAFLLEKSLVIYKNDFSKNHPTIAWNLAQLGNIYREMGNYEKARTLLEESLTIYEKYFPNSHDRIAWSFTHLGDIYTFLGDASKAYNALQKALFIHEKYFSKNHVGVARTLMCLGNAHREFGNYQKSNDTLEKSLLVHQKYFSEKHLRLAPVYMNLGITYRDLGNYAEAKTFLKKSLVIYAHNEGNHTIEAARVLRSLGYVCLLEGKIDASEKLIRQSLEMGKKNSHPDIYKTWESLADLYLKKSVQSESTQCVALKKQADDFLTQALKVIETHLPKNTIHATRIQNKRAKIRERG